MLGLLCKSADPSFSNSFFVYVFVAIFLFAIIYFTLMVISGNMEYKFGVESMFLIHQWITIKWRKGEFLSNRDWYHYYLKDRLPDGSCRIYFKVTDIWRRKEDYAEVLSYVTENWDVWQAYIDKHKDKDFYEEVIKKFK